MKMIGKFVKGLLAVAVLSLSMVSGAQAISLYAVPTGSAPVDTGILHTVPGVTMTIDIYQSHPGETRWLSIDYTFSGMAVSNAVNPTVSDFGVDGANSNRILGSVMPTGDPLLVATIDVTSGGFGEILTITNVDTYVYGYETGLYLVAGTVSFDIVQAGIPEPGTALLLGLGLVGMATVRRQRA